MGDSTCKNCGRYWHEHSRDALKRTVTYNDIVWEWQESACPVGDTPFHPTQVFATSSPVVSETGVQEVRLCVCSCGNIHPDPNPSKAAASVLTEEQRKCGHKMPLLNQDCIECAKEIPDDSSEASHPQDERGFEEWWNIQIFAKGAPIKAIASVTWQAALASRIRK